MARRKRGAPPLALPAAEARPAPFPAPPIAGPRAPDRVARGAALLAQAPLRR